MMVHFIKRHVRVIAAALGIVTAAMICDFLLLVTSLGFHWWRPFWDMAVSRVMLVLLVILSIAYSLLYAFRLWANVQVYRKRGSDVPVMRRLIVSGEGLALLLLVAVWGCLVLGGQPSVLPLRLLGVAYASGFVALVALRFYELRRERRHSAD